MMHFFCLPKPEQKQQAIDLLFIGIKLTTYFNYVTNLITKLTNFRVYLSVYECCKMCISLLMDPNLDANMFVKTKTYLYLPICEKLVRSTELEIDEDG